MMKNDVESGSVVVNVLITIAVIVILITIWKVGIPLLKNFMLSSDVRTFVNYDRENKIADPSMVRSVWNKIKTQVENRNIPIRDQDIKVDWELDKIIVDIQYSWPVNLFGFTFDIPFHIHHESEGPGFSRR